MGMASTLSKRDINVLEKIRDPESDPSMALLLDDTLPKDPNVRNQDAYDHVSQREREVVLEMQEWDMEMAGLGPRSQSDPVEEYQKCVVALDAIIAAHP